MTIIITCLIYFQTTLIAYVLMCRYSSLFYIICFHKTWENYTGKWDHTGKISYPAILDDPRILLYHKSLVGNLCHLAMSWPITLIVILARCIMFHIRITLLSAYELGRRLNEKPTSTQTRNRTSKTDLNR